MGHHPDYQYSEIRQIGTDYEDEAEVKAYDERMQRLRNIHGGIEEIIDLLRPQPDQTILDIGAGTGEMAIAIAKRCSRVYAIDVSSQMQRFAEKKAIARGISNIKFLQAGFLSYEHEGPPLDAVISQLALHHLPDFWKQVALLRIADMLKPGGLLYLEDVVYSFQPRDWKAALNEFIEGVSRSDVKNGSRQIIGHIKDEHSTFSWILEGMLERAGFKLESRNCRDGFITAYLCTRV